MVTIKLQNTEVPALGFGTWELQGKVCARQVERALNLGYRLIDTARAYDNEAEVGRGIESSGISRDEIFLTTKIWRDNLAAPDVLASAEESLRLLKTDTIDLLLIHWPNPEIPLEETLQAMVKLRDQGKIKHMGVSNFPPTLFEQACELAPIFCNQVEYHPLLGQAEILSIARRRDLLVTAYSPLAQGEVFKHPVMAGIADKYGKNPGQIALKWLILQENVNAIPRTSNEEHLKSNLEIFDFDLSLDDVARIDAIPKNNRQVSPAGIAPDWEEG